jgi:hypothetical protein
MGIFYQNRLKPGLPKNKVDYAKIQDYLVLLTIGSYSKGNASRELGTRSGERG